MVADEGLADQDHMIILEKDIEICPFFFEKLRLIYNFGKMKMIASFHISIFL